MNLCKVVFRQSDVSAMVSAGIKSSKLSIKHLAKTFYFVLSFLF